MFTGVCRAHAVNLLVSEGAWAEAEQEAAAVALELAELNVEAVAEAEYLEVGSRTAAAAWAHEQRLGWSSSEH